MLNDLAIRKFPVPEAGVSQHPDGKVPGFGVRVTANGVRSFYLAYRHKGKNRRLNLGRYPATSLQKARGKAYAALAELEDGNDPSGQGAKADTFAGAMDAFIDTHCKRHNRASTAAETERLLRVYFLPEWKNRASEAIAKADVAEVLEPVMKRGSHGAARHAFAAIRKMFNWMVEQGMLETSPCTGMKAPGKPGSRDRVLSDDELKIISKSSDAIGLPFGPIVQLLMMTAQRRGEVVAMAWVEIDEAKAVWTIPGERTKNGKSHAVPLTASALKILAAIPRTRSPYVFPARGKPDQPYAGYSKGKRELDAAADLHDWTLHDLRRTAATGMARLGIAPHVVERVLNHVSGTFAGVAGVYNRFKYEDEMRAALEVWEQHLKKFADAR
jgi:integrase